MTTLEPLLTPEQLAEITPWSAYHIREAARRQLVRSHRLGEGRGAKIGLLFSEFLMDTECPMAPANQFVRRCAERIRKTA